MNISQRSNGKNSDNSNQSIISYTPASLSKLRHLSWQRVHIIYETILNQESPILIPDKEYKSYLWEKAKQTWLKVLTHQDFEKFLIKRAKQIDHQELIKWYSYLFKRNLNHLESQEITVKAIKKCDKIFGEAYAHCFIIIENILKDLRKYENDFDKKWVCSQLALSILCKVLYIKPE